MAAEENHAAQKQTAVTSGYFIGLHSDAPESPPLSLNKAITDTQTIEIGPVLIWYWASVEEGEPTLRQFGFKVAVRWACMYRLWNNSL